MGLRDVPGRLGALLASWRRGAGGWPGRWRRGRHGVKSFDAEVAAAGGIRRRVDGGLRTVQAEKIVGSVGRAANLRSDFFYRTGRAMTQRFLNVGRAMQQGKALPPLELYKLRRPRPQRQPQQQPAQGSRQSEASEYYVLDGHHRVAMGRRLGQDFFDAHVIEHTVEGSEERGPEGGGPEARGSKPET